MIGWIIRGEAPVLRYHATLSNYEFLRRYGWLLTR